jgi:chemotaxis protein methyltransferase CheR
MTPKAMPIKAVAPADTLSLAQFVRFRDLIEERCGLHFDKSQRTSLSASLGVRMRQLGIDQIDDYYDLLCRRTDDEGFRKLINLVTVTETCFFRDPSQFRLLRQHVLPTLLARRGSPQTRTVRIWSAGCSSGEEAYSIALILSEMGLLSASAAWRFEIVGTDVNTEVLESARRGVYSARALRNVEGDLLRRYFRPDAGRFCLDDAIKRAVRFEYANLTHVPLPRPVGTGQDIVFCKNVTIYFQPEMTRRLVGQLHDALAEGGFLLLGHSESLWQMDAGFALVEHEGAFCYRKAPRRVEVAVRQRQESSRADQAAISPPAPADTVPGEYDRCLAAFRAEDWTQAEALLDALIESSPAFVPARLLLGGVYVHRGRYDEAFAQAERVLALTDLEPRAHLLIGMIAAQRGRPDEALQALRRALYLDDSLALAHFWLGNLYRDQGDIGRANIEYEHVVRGWELHTLDLTEMFASDLSAEQLVDFCLSSLRRPDALEWRPDASE